MSNVVSLRDLEEMIRKGEDARTLPADAILTPSARDFLRELETAGGRKSGAGASPAATSASSKLARLAPPAKQSNSKSSKAELEAFFNSPALPYKTAQGYGTTRKWIGSTCN